MRVLTLDTTGLREHCLSLQKQVGDYDPDLIVGIATGGAVVAHWMYHDVDHVEVTCRRPGTTVKQRAGWLFNLLRHLPQQVLNSLRIAEIKVLQMRRSRPKRLVEPISEPTMRKIAAASRILVVDDSVDSGTTLTNVLKVLKAIPGNRQIRSAAITVTMPQECLLQPDYAIYRNSTLIRFPWSHDAANPSDAPRH